MLSLVSSRIFTSDMEGDRNAFGSRGEVALGESVDMVFEGGDAPDQSHVIPTERHSDPQATIELVLTAVDVRQLRLDAFEQPLLPLSDRLNFAAELLEQFGLPKEVWSKQASQQSS